jgi:hypothetical protein
MIYSLMKNGWKMIKVWKWGENKLEHLDSAVVTIRKIKWMEEAVGALLTLQSS